MGDKLGDHLMPPLPEPRDLGRYQYVKDIGKGNFGVTHLVRDPQTGEYLAVKYIPRGHMIDENVQREIVNHRMLWHPNIIRFKEVLLTPTHLAIVMEYASSGELFDRICRKGRFHEAEARFFFQQLVSGVSYVHSQQICHRDLKLENTLLDGNTAPRVKICDFGYSKSSLYHSAPDSRVGTPAYIAPEVIFRKKYDGKMADVWSLGVMLYAMLVGSYPFEDPKDPHNYRKTIQRIMAVQYTIPDHLSVSPECKQLLARIFVVNPAERITMDEIKQHKWYLQNLPGDLDRPLDAFDAWDGKMQSCEDIAQVLAEACIEEGATKYQMDGVGLGSGNSSANMSGNSQLAGLLEMELDADPFVGDDLEADCGAVPKTYHMKAEDFMKAPPAGKH